MASVTVQPVSGHKYQLNITAGKHTIVADQPTQAGGSDGGMNPKEILLAAIGACVAQTIIMVASQKNMDLQELTVKVSYTKPNKQEVYEEEIEVKGNLSQTELDAIKRAAERCPVVKSFTGTKTVKASVTKI